MLFLLLVCSDSVVIMIFIIISIEKPFKMSHNNLSDKKLILDKVIFKIPVQVPISKAIWSIYQKNG